jgi:hypothetical protein
MLQHCGPRFVPGCDEIWLPCPGAAASINGETHHGRTGGTPLATVGVARRLVGLCCGGFGQRPHRACTSPIVGAAAGQDDQGTSRVSDDAERLYSCATCTLFVPPNLCKVVEGEVSPDGWRKAFALAD